MATVIQQQPDQQNSQAPYLATLHWGWRKTLRRLWIYQKPYWLPFAIGVLLLGSSLVFDIGMGLIQETFFNQMRPGHLHLLLRLIWTTLSVGVGLTGLSAIQHYCRYVASAYADRALALRLLTKISHLPFRNLQRLHSADFVSRIVNDTGLANNALASLIYDVFYQVLLGLVAFYFLAKINGFAAVVAMLVGPALFLLGRFFDKRIRSVSEEIQRQEAAIRSGVQESIQNMAAIRAYNLESKTLTTFSNGKQQQNQLVLKRTVFQTSMWQLILVAQGGVQVFAAFLVALNALKGHLSPGQVMTFVFLMSNVQTPFMRMSQVWNGIQQSLGAAERVFQVEQLQDETSFVDDTTPATYSALRTDASQPVPAIEVLGADLTVVSEDRNAAPAYLLNNISLSVNAGETIAIVGPSGAGKTSLARLLCGLYRPDGGNVRLFGHSTVTDLDRAKQAVSYVPQQPYLFSLSVRENIAMGRPNCTDEEVIDAAKAASAHEFIMQLEQGYDTKVGEQGYRLSGGQRQRIAMARAFLQNTPIIILDEPTSALDNETEVAIQNALESMAKQRTLVIIAHRLSTIRKANRIVVLEGGTVVESGRHVDLMADGGLYSRLVELQTT